MPICRFLCESHCQLNAFSGQHKTLLSITGATLAALCMPSAMSKLWSWVLQCLAKIKVKAWLHSKPKNLYVLKHSLTTLAFQGMQKVHCFLWATPNDTRSRSLYYAVVWGWNHTHCWPHEYALLPMSPGPLTLHDHFRSKKDLMMQEPMIPREWKVWLLIGSHPRASPWITTYHEMQNQCVALIMSTLVPFFAQQVLIGQIPSKW